LSFFVPTMSSRLYFFAAGELLALLPPLPAVLLLLEQALAARAMSAEAVTAVTLRDILSPPR
jgi:hypothetical protein